MNQSLVAVRWTLALLALTLLPGCFLLGAGAGAGTAVYFTDRGASSLTDGSLEAVAARTQRVFTEMRIELVDTTHSGDGDDIEFKGRNGPLEITVDLEREGPDITLVQVSAKREEVVWNKDYARMVLERIIKSR